MSTETATFGKWRSRLWPVHAFELKKLLPMLLLLLCINFNYTILRDTKDALIVTAPGSGAEAIPFLKVWGVLPLAILFMLGFAKLSNMMSKQKLFYTVISTFLGFFAIFALVLYPNREALHPTAMADRLQEILPAGFSGMVALLRNWTYALFYIMAELWGSMALSLLFWGFANDITKVSEAKRFYALFGLGANVGMIISGPTIIYFSNIRSKLPADVDAWGWTLNYLTGLVIIAGIVAMFTYRWINKNVLTDERFYDPSQVKKKKKKKEKMSLKDSFGYILKSKYVLCLAILVISYGVAIQLVEVTWKSQVKLQYPNPNEYNAFMGYFSTITGAITILMMLFVGGNVIRRFGWGAGALFTPVMLIITGALFFSFVLFRHHLEGVIGLIGTTPLFLAVVIGMLQNIFSKSSKYSLFDPTKEMAYIPLDDEVKVKGKAAIDVVGARFGKSGGALINQVLIVLTGSVALIAPYVAGILFVIVLGWVVSAKSLNKQFVALTAEKDKEDKEAERETASSEPALATAEAEK